MIQQISASFKPRDLLPVNTRYRTKRVEKNLKLKKSSKRAKTLNHSFDNRIDVRGKAKNRMMSSRSSY